LNANISKKNNCINHKALLNKLKTLLSLTKQVKAWLKADIIAKLGNNLQYMEIINMGTCGIIFFPLLANIALHGMETSLREWALKTHPKKLTPILVKYVKNFVILHQSGEVLEQAQTF